MTKRSRFECHTFKVINSILILGILNFMGTLDSSAHASPPLKMVNIIELKKILADLHKGLEPKGMHTQKSEKRLNRILIKIEKFEQLTARYFHHSDATQQRGAALSARRLILNELRTSKGLLEIVNGRLCLKAYHRANLAGSLLQLGLAKQAIEQLKKGASCTMLAQSFWDEIYLIARTASFKDIIQGVQARVSPTLKSRFLQPSSTIHSQ